MYTLFSLNYIFLGINKNLITVYILFFYNRKRPPPSWRVQSKKNRRKFEIQQETQFTYKYRGNRFETGFTAFLVLENHRIATKILILRAIGKKLTELPTTAHWEFVGICIMENPQKIYKPRLIMGKYREQNYVYIFAPNYIFLVVNKNLITVYIL